MKCYVFLKLPNMFCQAIHSTKINELEEGGNSEQSKVLTGSRAEPQKFLALLKFEDPEYTGSSVFKRLFLQQTPSIYSHL